MGDPVLALGLFVIRMEIIGLLDYQSLAWYIWHKAKTIFVEGIKQNEFNL